MFVFRFLGKQYGVYFTHRATTTRVKLRALPHNQIPTGTKTATHVEVRGFATFCRIVDITNTKPPLSHEVFESTFETYLAQGVAKLNPNDQFDKRIGRKVALAKALNNLTVGMNNPFASAKQLRTACWNCYHYSSNKKHWIVPEQCT